MIELLLIVSIGFSGGFILSGILSAGERADLEAEASTWRHLYQVEKEKVGELEDTIRYQANENSNLRDTIHFLEEYKA